MYRTLNKTIKQETFNAICELFINAYTCRDKKKGSCNITYHRNSLGCTCVIVILQIRPSLCCLNQVHLSNGISSGCALRSLKHWSVQHQILSLKQMSCWPLHHRNVLSGCQFDLIYSFPWYTWHHFTCHCSVLLAKASHSMPPERTAIRAIKGQHYGRIPAQNGMMSLHYHPPGLEIY